jgi:hypothetical protein
MQKLYYYACTTKGNRMMIHYMLHDSKQLNALRQLMSLTIKRRERNGGVGVYCPFTPYQPTMITTVSFAGCSASPDGITPDSFHHHALSTGSEGHVPLLALFVIFILVYVRGLLIERLFIGGLLGGTVIKYAIVCAAMNDLLNRHLQNRHHTLRGHRPSFCRHE